jgi:hypothetical protein
MFSASATVATTAVIRSQLGQEMHLQDATRMQQ